MVFIKKEIKGEELAVVDIGSYKIRVGICELRNKEIKLIGYGEKRQNSSDIVLGEFLGIKGICENIKLAIKKAEIDAKQKINKVIINFPFGEVFFSCKKINYRREFSQDKIDKKELQKIIRIVERRAYETYMKEIEINTPYEKGDLKIILSSITRIKLDSKKTDNLIGKRGENINLCLLNVFISYDKYGLVRYIEKAISKKIMKIFPTEIAITKVFDEKKDIIIVDVGNNNTSIIVKKNNYVNGIQKLNIGINDLIKCIGESTKKTKIDIINSIDKEDFVKEKQEFLNIFKNCLILGLEEILKGEICPNQFFIIGGGANNFLKNYIKRLNLNKDNIKMIGDIEIVDICLDFMEELNSKSNILIGSMIKSAEKLIFEENNPITKSIELVIKEIEREY